MERQATQPAAVPSGRKRRRVSPSSKKPKGEKEATRELEMALNGLPRADAEEAPVTHTTFTSNGVVINQARVDPLTPPTPSPVCSVDDLMEGTLKDYEEECLDEGTVQADPAQEDYVLDKMDTQLNELLYETCPFHPSDYIYCVNPQTQFGQLRFKCPHEGCPVYLFEDSREVMMEKMKEDTHPQVRARLQRGELKCKCGLVPKMKLSRTSKNYQKVFFSCGSFLPGQDSCGYFQWLHGPLWCPRDPAQPTLRRWVRDAPREIHYKEYQPIYRRPSPEREFIEKNRPWLNQFGEAIKAKERERERTRPMSKNFVREVLF